jgi:excisionase family DNA binding protein
MAKTIRWLTTAEAAERASCTQKTIRRAVRQGRLHAARIRGGELRFLENWIAEWLVDQVAPEDGEIDMAIEAAPSRRTGLPALA